MKGCIFLILLIALALAGGGCKKSEIRAPEGDTSGIKTVEDAAEPGEGENALPEELRGKTIKEIAGNQTLLEIDTSEPVDDDPSDDEIDEESYDAGPGVEIVEIRKTPGGMAFFPQEAAISAGESVMWVNKLDYLDKKAKVTVYQHHNYFRSPSLAYDEAYTFTFEEAGEWTYSAVPYEYLFKPGTITVR